MSPSINNPGGVKNAPDEITDAVFTTGSPVDPDSLRSSPVNWEQKTPKVTKISSGSKIDISGSGYLTGLMSPASGSTSATCFLRIDGTTLNNFSVFELSNGSGKPGVSCLHRFDTSLKVFENSGNGEILASYLLD